LLFFFLLLLLPLSIFTENAPDPVLSLSQGEQQRASLLFRSVFFFFLSSSSLEELELLTASTKKSGIKSFSEVCVSLCVVVVYVVVIVVC